MRWKRNRNGSANKQYLLYLIIALSVGIAIFFLRYAKSPSSSTSVGTVSTATTPKGAVRTHKVKTPPPQKIVAYDKEELAFRLKMPELKNEIGLPIAVAEIPSHPGPTTTIAMLDNTTGESRIIQRPEPPPFFNLKKEFGVRGGFGTGNLIVGEIYLRPLALNPKDGKGQLNLELRGYARRTDADGSDFGGVILLDYRF